MSMVPSLYVTRETRSYCPALTLFLHRLANFSNACGTFTFYTVHHSELALCVMEGTNSNEQAFFIQKHFVFSIEDHIDNPEALRKNVTETLVLALKDPALHLCAML